ncbi:indolepyruvate ferredoxin oxidoreductase family protein [Rhodobacteraceae bacterium D3-12]|nr:indolepyruvate ferredoxin oxidoreductase family protein [Rhodobacteraceae bacterium D3-12]
MPPQYLHQSPGGSTAASGIGCHVMASWMDRQTVGYAQMGGEGVPWVAASKFSGNKHIFQNLGEGTWYHSGSLAIRQAVAAKTNITYKILYNDAVAMTGGQPVDGPISVDGIAHVCHGEGVERIAVVSDNVAKFNQSDFPIGTSFSDRADLEKIQRELRDIPGVTVLIYEQTCATEKRRRRKRGKLPDPKKFVVINELVCEGCGDCSVASNCLSVEPKQSDFGVKRQINQSSCNKDYSCLEGFCPSFVTVEGATRRKKSAINVDFSQLLQDLPPPEFAPLTEPYDLLVAGVGGTGVVTVGALITMAAHLEGKGASVLDFTGFAQKFGTVLGYVRLANTPDAIHQVRIETSAADAVIGCDAVVCSSPKASAHYRKGSQFVLNRAEMPTGDLVLNRDASLKIDQREAEIRKTVGDDVVTAFDANKISEQVMGDTVFANIILLGAAWQRGMVPVSEAAMKQAILLNGVAVEQNSNAFDLGRLLIAPPKALRDVLTDAPNEEPSCDEIIAQRAAFLEGYQNGNYADHYVELLTNFRNTLSPELENTLLGTAAKSLFKLMAIKDEYEVARLHTQQVFSETLSRDFEGDFKVKYHLAPPFLPSKRDSRGRPRKRQFGAWMTPVLKGLARMKTLRGTLLDPFRFGADRKLDLETLSWFKETLREVGHKARPAKAELCASILVAPMDIRGYGPVREDATASVRARVDALLAKL